MYRDHSNSNRSGIEGRKSYIKFESEFDLVGNRIQFGRVPLKLSVKSAGDGKFLLFLGWFKRST